VYEEALIRRCWVKVDTGSIADKRQISNMQHLRANEILAIQWQNRMRVACVEKNKTQKAFEKKDNSLSFQDEALQLLAELEHE
jgi:hypothetical protein